MGQDLLDALVFRKLFALAICEGLRVGFDDNHIMTAFCILGSTNMPSRQVCLANKGVLDLELLCAQYDVK